MAETSDPAPTPGGPEGSPTSGIPARVVSEEDRASARERLSRLIETHGDELWRFVVGVTRSQEEASDVLQATFSRALDLGHAARAESYKGWIFRVAFHEALAARRRTRVGERALRRLAQRNAGSSDAPPVDQRLVREETAADIGEALAELPEPQRRVVLARIHDDRPFAEIARSEGVPLGTVLTRMRLALDKLRRRLQGRHDPEALP